MITWIINFCWLMAEGINVHVVHKSWYYHQCCHLLDSNRGVLCHSWQFLLSVHDDGTWWKHFLHYCSFVQGTQNRSLVSLHKQPVMWKMVPCEKANKDTYSAIDVCMLMIYIYMYWIILLIGSIYNFHSMIRNMKWNFEISISFYIMIYK